VRILSFTHDLLLSTSTNGSSVVDTEKRFLILHWHDEFRPFRVGKFCGRVNPGRRSVLAHNHLALPWATICRAFSPSDQCPSVFIRG